MQWVPRSGRTGVGSGQSSRVENSSPMPTCDCHAGNLSQMTTVSFETLLCVQKNTRPEAVLHSRSCHPFSAIPNVALILQSEPSREPKRPSIHRRLKNVCHRLAPIHQYGHSSKRGDLGARNLCGRVFEAREQAHAPPNGIPLQMAEASPDRSISLLSTRGVDA